MQSTGESNEDEVSSSGKYTQPDTDCMTYWSWTGLLNHDGIMGLTRLTPRLGIPLCFNILIEQSLVWFGVLVLPYLCTDSFIKCVHIITTILTFVISALLFIYGKMNWYTLHLQILHIHA